MIPTIAAWGGLIGTSRCNQNSFNLKSHHSIKSQISSTKSQINLKFQYSMTETFWQTAMNARLEI